MKIIQMIPATGYKAIMSGLEAEPFEVPILAWAIVELDGPFFGDEPATEIQGIGISTEYHEGPELVEKDEWFLGYTTIDDSLDNWKKLAAIHCDRLDKKEDERAAKEVAYQARLGGQAK